MTNSAIRIAANESAEKYLVDDLGRFPETGQREHNGSQPGHQDAADADSDEPAQGPKEFVEHGSSTT
jgi:hypothetical protein